ncbi:MAG: tetratricopeptide repeat protein [Bacteroidales bacterium]|nr:tetratricopeptide repeat protein [Bacteroidales bacterium]
MKVMKKIFLIAALAIVVTAAYAQKKNVSIADKATWEEVPNFTEARQAIQAAMVEPTTANQAKTWAVAGLVEMRFVEMEANKQAYGQPADEAGMYAALGDSYKYFLKAVELEKIPNEKGKVSTKYTKQIREKLKNNLVHFYYGGGYYNNNDNKEAAYTMFNTVDELCHQDFMAEAEINCQDSLHMQCRLLAAVVALQIGNYQQALVALEKSKADDFNGLDVYNYIAYAYGQLKDFDNQAKTFKEGLQKYGAAANGEDYAFMPRLINLYISQNKSADAISLIEEALVENPNDYEFWKVLGSLYYDEKNEVKAIEALKKSIEVNPEYADAYGELGRIYYNKAITISNETNEIQNNEEYKKAREEKVKPAFMEAAPYFEKALELKPYETNYMYNLKNIYYNAEDGANLERIEKLMGE